MGDYVDNLEVTSADQDITNAFTESGEYLTTAVASSLELNIGVANVESDVTVETFSVKIEADTPGAKIESVELVLLQEDDTTLTTLTLEPVSLTGPTFRSVTGDFPADFTTGRMLLRTESDIETTFKLSELLIKACFEPTGTTPSPTGPGVPPPGPTTQAPGVGTTPSPTGPGVPPPGPTTQAPGVECDKYVGMGDYVDNLEVTSADQDITNAFTESGEYLTTAVASSLELNIGVANVESDVTVETFSVKIEADTPGAKIESVKLVLLQEDDTTLTTLTLEPVSLTGPTFRSVTGDFPADFTTGRMLLRTESDIETTFKLSELLIKACFEPKGTTPSPTGPGVPPPGPTTQAPGVGTTPSPTGPGVPPPGPTTQAPGVGTTPSPTGPGVPPPGPTTQAPGVECDKYVGMGDYVDNLEVTSADQDITNAFTESGEYLTTAVASSLELNIGVANVESDVTVETFSVKIEADTPGAKIESVELVLLQEDDTTLTTLTLEPVSLTGPTFRSVAGDFPADFTSGGMVLRTESDIETTFKLSELLIKACFEPKEKVCRLTAEAFEEQMGSSPSGSAFGYIELNGNPGFNDGDELVSLDDEIEENMVVNVMCYKCECEKRTINCEPVENCTTTCEATPWSDWSECSASCNGGTQSRDREVVSSNPDCDNSEKDFRPCNTQTCEEPPEYTPWTEWSDCSATANCDEGVRVRTRQCQNDMCTDVTDTIEIEGCVNGDNCDDEKVCDEAMEEYDECANKICEDGPTTCFGEQFNTTCEEMDDVECVPGCACKNGRVRNEDGECVVPNQCSYCLHPDGSRMVEGERIEGLSPCEYCMCLNGVYTCAVEETCCEVGEWNEWTSCATDCGSGLRYRYRTTTSGCEEGSNVEEEECEKEPCKVCVHEQNWYAAWEQINSTDPCLVCYCMENGGMQCNEDIDADVDGDWSPWSLWQQCTSECGEGQRHRYRSCNSPAPQCGGNDCEGADTDSEPCNLPSCCTTSEWGDWSPCTASCDGGTQIRSRNFTDAADINKEECDDVDLTDSETCNENPCDEECTIGPWSEWSECSESCGGGSRTRSRDTTCEVTKEETGGCNEQACIECEDTAEYKEFTQCEQNTCERYRAGQESCRDNGTKYWGCVCNEGYLMNDNKECVKPTECNSCSYQGMTYEEDEVVYSEECSHFICVKGDIVETSKCEKDLQCGPGEVLIEGNGCCPECKPAEETPDKCQEQTKEIRMEYNSVEHGKCVSDKKQKVKFCGGSCGNSLDMPMLAMPGDKSSNANCKCCSGDLGERNEVEMTCVREGGASTKHTAFYQNMTNCKCNQCVGEETTSQDMGFPIKR
ncbi:SCO-spondin-like isoform X2 [Mya arenaria]|uniref:SCO-spondin-like isoform X2 n=1 Tax=Mya arenaria TaxID=6604 RepID=UPI0022E96279|nr:SCO-spondin-like isoform X2 [Mya arenaria]